MTEAVQLALIVGMPPTLAALGALFVSVRNSVKADETGKKADTIIEKAAEIHTLTNSNLSAVTKTLEVANEKILGLERLMAQMLESNKTAATEKVATDLRAAMLTQVVQPAVQAPTRAPARAEDFHDKASAEASLKNIDQHTEAIEQNTKKTDQTVQAIKDKTGS